MGRIVGTREATQASGTTITAALPDHVANDILMVCVNSDLGTIAITADATTTSAGWAIIGTQQSNDNHRQTWHWLKAAGSSTVAPVFNVANGAAIATAIVVRGVDGTAPIHQSARSDHAAYAAGGSNSTTVTTTVDDCLLIYSWCADGVSTRLRTLSNDTINVAKVGISDSCQIIGYRQQDAAGISPVVKCYASTGEGGTGWVIALKNDSAGDRAFMCANSADEHNLLGSFGAFNTAFGTAYAPNDIISSGTLDGISISSTVASYTTSGGTGTSLSLWGTASQITSTENTVGAWVGVVRRLSANKDMSGKLYYLHSNIDLAVTRVGDDGIAVVFADASGNWVAYQLANKLALSLVTQRVTAIALGNATALGSSGTMDWTQVAKIGYVYHRIGSSASGTAMFVKNEILYGTAVITGGGPGAPAMTNMLPWAYTGWDIYKASNLQGSAQVMNNAKVQIGDGASETYFSAAASSFEYPTALSRLLGSSQQEWNVNTGQVGYTIYASANDTIDLSAAVIATTTAQPFTIHASSSTSAAYSFVGTSFIGWDVTWKTGIPCAGASFKQCGMIDFKAVDVSALAVNTGRDDCLISVDDGFSDTDGTYTAGGSAIYAMRIDAAGTFTLSDTTFSGFTFDLDVTAATGTVTVVLATDTTVEPTYQTAGATVVFDAPVIARGLAFTGLIAGSQVVVFTTGTQTELFRDDASATSETWSEATAGSRTVDYTVMKAGYRPIRVTGVTVTAAISGGVLATPIIQVLDRTYVASSGLTYTTDTTATVGTKLFTLRIASTLQNWYSHMIEVWIAQAAFANVEFPLSSNGPNSITLGLGWEWRGWTTAGTGISNTSLALLSRDGMRYLNTSGTATAIWAALLSNGVIAGQQVRYQQADGTGTTNAATTGNIDQLIQVYGDATHGNYDKRGWLVLKVQTLGDYDQAEADAVVTYGTLEDQLYVVGLAPTQNGVAAQAGITGITITSEATPVTWNGQDFSVTITDTDDSHSGLQIMQYVRGLNDFNWHDFIRPNGSKFRTVNGAVYGDTLPTPAGVRVVKADGTTPHPDFDVFSADDGATYAPPVVANISITGMPDAVGASTRLQIINTAAETAAAWQATTAYADGDVRLRTTGAGTETTAGLYLRCTTAGTSAGIEPTWNTTPGGTTADGTVTWTTYSVLFYDADPAGTAYSGSYTEGNEFLAGESVEIRFAEMDAGTNFKRYHTTTIASSAGFSALVAEEADDVYSTNAIDGSAYEATYSPNFIDNYVVLDSNTDFSALTAYAYFCYTLTSSNGMYLFWDGVTALDVGNYRIETDVLDLFFDESAGFVKQTDSARIFRKDGLRPALDPTTGGSGIEINWRTPVSVVSTGGSAMTAEESAHLLALNNAPAAATVAAQTRTELATELGRLDAAVSSRLAGSGYTTAPTASAVADAIAAKTMGARSLSAHVQAQSAALLGATSGAGTAHLTFTDGAAVVEADVPLPGVAGDRSNVVISGV